MTSKYGAVVLHLLAAFSSARKAGLDDRILAKGGFQSLLVANHLGHELSDGQEFDAFDSNGKKYEYKVTNQDRPRSILIFSKHGSINDAVDKKLGCLDGGVVFAVVGESGVQACYLADSNNLAKYAKAHFLRIAEKSSKRCGRPRANSTLETRSLNFTIKSFCTIPNVCNIFCKGMP